MLQSKIHSHQTRSSRFKTSLNRFIILAEKSNNSHIAATDDTRADVFAEDSSTQFMANFSFGDPAVAHLLTMDTGSNLLWIQCLPCTKCFGQSSPLFDPSKSSTFTALPCSSPSCTVLQPEHKYDLSDNCKFSHGYLDGTLANGLLGTEMLTFETSDDGLSTINDVVFGRAHNNDGFNGQPSGILGLGPPNLSLATKLASKFSYCIANIRDPNYSYNQLILGDGEKFEGDSTPLEVFNELYYLNLEYISVGGKKLDIDPETFRRKPSGDGGTVIDSGMTLSFVAKAGYEALSGEVEKLMDGFVKRVMETDIPTALCYKGVISRDLVGFLEVSFGFSGGAELSMGTESLFEEYGEGEFCMAVHESMSKSDLTVVGIMAQQGYNVAYDGVGMTVSFQSIDCQLLEG
ncbi:aspartic proteinase nepenthesin-2 [Ziziphus jujuba]|uniref:Aspartic proteinase nepenthesin-2 n=1 Tax=Ziziphus jujuba TaxID=326968 RepID=A0ABM3I180_ZIZJJ|nr:aspartic proteinase nepenthesin-2 [Ziziphus jujuba]